eukprot:3369439-Rhodomonas_salina.3
MAQIRQRKVQQPVHPRRCSCSVAQSDHILFAAQRHGARCSATSVLCCTPNRDSHDMRKTKTQSETETETETQTHLN